MSKRMRQETTTFLLRLPPELKIRLAEAAKQDSRSMSNFVLLAIEAACARAEEKNNKPLEGRKNA